MAKKKTTPDQDQKLEESWEKFRGALEACQDYLGLLGDAGKAAPGYMWLYVIGEDLPIPRALYLVDSNFIIYGVDAVPGEQKDVDLSAAELRAIMIDEDTPATLFQLILDIDARPEITPEQHAAIKAGLVDQLAETGELVTMEQLIRRPALAPLKRFIVPNTKIHNNLALLDVGVLQDVAMDGQLQFVTHGRDDVFSIVSLQYTGADQSILARHHMNGYDVQIYDAISSLYIHSIKERPSDPVILTPQNIWACMNGGKGDPTARQVDRIRRSLDKWRFTLCHLDISLELQKHYIKAADGSRFVSGSYDGYLLNADRIRFETEKGNAIEGYRIHQAPIIYEYSALRDELLSVPIELLNTSDYVSNTEDVIAFRGYLVRRIASMRRGKLHNDVIRLETIYKETGIEPPEKRVQGKGYADPQREARKQAKKDRDNIKGILQSWTDRGWILGYQEKLTGTAITGFKISLDQELILEGKAADAKKKKRKR